MKKYLLTMFCLLLTTTVFALPQQAKSNVLFIAVDDLNTWVGHLGATHAPLIWVVPGVTKPSGVSARTVDFMSIFPTLCDLTGISTPAHNEGKSIRALLTNPKATWDTPAITTYGRNNHAIRTEKWRYIRYADGGEELYDHEKDPHEWTNLANKPELASVKAELARWFPKVNKPAARRGNNGGDGE